MTTTNKNIFSFKAEFQGDLHVFFIVAGKVAIKRKEMISMTKYKAHPGELEAYVEFESTLDLETLKGIADKCMDCHRIEQTMRQCSMEENSFNW